MAKDISYNRAMELVLEECEACFRSRLRKDQEASCLLGELKVIRIDEGLKCMMTDNGSILCQFCVFRRRSDPEELFDKMIDQLNKM